MKCLVLRLTVVVGEWLRLRRRDLDRRRLSRSLERGRFDLKTKSIDVKRNHFFNHNLQTNLDRDRFRLERLRERERFDRFRDLDRLDRERDLERVLERVRRWLTDFSFDERIPMTGSMAADIIFWASFTNDMASAISRCAASLLFASGLIIACDEW